MGKRKDKEEDSSGERLDIASPHKKAKHKHKKHKKKRERSSSNSEEIDVVGLDMKKEAVAGFGSLKLKIKFGGETQVVNVDKQRDVNEPKVLHIAKLQPPIQIKQEILREEIIETEEVDINEEFDDEEEDEEIEEEIQEISIVHSDDLQQGLDSEEDIDDSDDEEESRQPLEESASEEYVRPQDPPKKSKKEEDEEGKWLDALEAGELDDMGRLKKEKDISLMTTRQRALYGHLVEGETELLELPSLAKRRDEDSEEAQLRRTQRAKKRKQQMQKQIEETKAQTIDKLLNKQAAKLKKEAKHARQRLRRHGAHIKYVNGRDFVSISLTKGIEFPLKPQPPRAPPAPIKCSVDGCHNNKTYSCSKTRLPICGLSCYKKIQQLYVTPVS